MVFWKTLSAAVRVSPARSPELGLSEVPGCLPDRRVFPPRESRECGEETRRSARLLHFHSPSFMPSASSLEAPGRSESFRAIQTDIMLSLHRLLYIPIF